MSKFLYILGTSGSGKTTLAKRLQNIKSNKFKRIVQYSTREKRVNEQDGIDYHFISEDTYKDFLERRSLF